MLSCQEITQLVTEYVEGSLSRRDRLRFQLHLGMCRHCRAYVRQMRLAAKTLNGLQKPELLPEVESELLARFESWKTSRGR